MALTRKLLKEMSIDEEKIEKIIAAHSETVEALKGFKSEAERLRGLEEELGLAKQELSLGYRQKYEALLSDFEGYKLNVEQEKTNESLRRKKADGFERVLRDLNVAQSCIKPIMRVTDIDAIELSEDGDLADADAVVADVIKNWSSFIEKSHTEGAFTPNPPENVPKRVYSADDIRKMSYGEINQNYREIVSSLGGKEL